jgi:hypothetical protein
MSAPLSLPARETRIAALKRGIPIWLIWIPWPIVMEIGLGLAWIFGRHLVESADSPGKAEDWLRYVIYSLILIVLMLMRPQGLLGRHELNFTRWRNRRNPAKTADAEPADAGVQGSL